MHQRNVETNDAHVKRQFGPEVSKMTVLFFARGRGLGHAMCDMAIVRELSKLRDDFDLRYVSYGTGALGLSENGQSVIDLDLPDANPLWPTVVRAAQVIAQTRPSLVIAHEEFSIPPLARIFAVPVIFVTEWFSDPGDHLMEALSYADDIIVIEDAGVFEEPPNVDRKIFYAGPVLRDFKYTVAQRQRAREELGFPPDSTVILIAPGSWTEEVAPIFDTVLPAFDSLKIREKLMVWVAGTDCEILGARLGGRKDVILKGRDWQLDRLMVASDVAITKTNRTTVRELAALGIPSISISYGRNPIDDILIERIPSNTALDARTVSRKLLANSILDALRDGVPEQSPGPASALNSRESGAVLAARRIAEKIQAIACP